MSLALLALVAAAAEPPAPWSVNTALGETLVCWRPLPERGDLSEPPDQRLQVGDQRVWASQRCVQAPADTPVGLRPEALRSPIAPGPFVWLGPPREPPLLPDAVLDVTTGPDGAIWLARCHHGVTRLDPQAGTRRTWTDLDGLPRGCVTEVAVNAEGVGWAITPDRVAVLDPQRPVVTTFPFDVADRASVAAVHAASGGWVWLGGQGGRLRGLRDVGVGEVQGSLVVPPEDGPSEARFGGADLGALGTIDAIREAPDGTLWLSSRDRLTLFKPEQGTFELRVPHGAAPGLPAGRPGPVTFSVDGAWAIVQPDTPGVGPTRLVHLRPGGFHVLSLPGLPERPLRLHGTDDGALWISDAAGVVRVDPTRTEARRVALRVGYVPGGPWTTPACASDRVWAATRGHDSGATLDLLGPDGSKVRSLAPATLPPAGTLVGFDDGVLLATAEGFWVLDLERASWSAHVGFGDGLAGWSPRRLRALRTSPSGRVWLAGDDGLRVGRADLGWQEVPPPGESAQVLDVLEGPDGTTWIAAADGLYVRDRVGRTLRVVDDGGRGVAGVQHLRRSQDGRLWGWGSGGAWTITGSDARRELGGPVLDLVLDQGPWVVRADGVRRREGERLVRVELPPRIMRPEQIVVRDGELAWVRARNGLWRREGDAWHKVLGSGDGQLLRSGDGSLWRWDPDGLHVLPPSATTWRWVGLPASRDAVVEPVRSALIDADAISVLALDGVLAVQVEGRVVGDPLRPDPIVDLDVRGTRWAALSRRGVLLRGDGWRVLEQSYVPGPARRVALGPRGVCVAGSGVWCRHDGRWQVEVAPLDLPAPLPAVALAVDASGQAWSLHPGALCRADHGCRGVPGLGQTSLLLDPRGGAWMGTLQGLYRVDDRGVATLVRSGAVLDLAAAVEGGLWLATEAQGLVSWNDGTETPFGRGADPRGMDAPMVVHQVAAQRNGLVWARSGDARYLLDQRPDPSRRDRWPWQQASRAAARCSTPASP